MSSDFTHDEHLRYSRHLLIPEVGAEGQARLKAARVLLVGAGGLGSPVALYLAAAGVGRLGLVEFDRVELSNLQRQIIHGTRDLGRSKLDSARDRILDINPHVQVVGYETRLTAGNALEIFRDYDMVIDGTDNFATRYLINDACVLLGKPLIYGSVSRFDGQASVFATQDGPCYRCLCPTPPAPEAVPSCAEAGVLGVLPGLVGVIQATEAIKWIIGAGESLRGKLLLINALEMRFTSLRLERNPKCPACGTRELQELVDYEAFCGVARVPELSPRELRERLARNADFELLDVREEEEWAVARIEGARLAPLSRLSEFLPGLTRGREIIVHCQSGARSATAVRKLRAAGFERVYSLAGGIVRYLSEVESVSEHSNRG